jgi:ATP-dependent DNA helicase RecG
MLSEIYNPKTIKQLLKKGEGIDLEFKEAKSSLNKSFWETVCAFLNRDGGKILLGVDDNGAITGVDEKALDLIKKSITDNSNNPELLKPAFILYPKLIQLAKKKIILVDVPSSSQVHSYKNKIYDRAENHFLLELDNEALLKALGLYRLDLAQGLEGYTLAAALLFGKDQTIQNIVPHFKIDALVRVQDLDRYDDRLEVRSNLIEAYELLMDFVKKHLPDPFYEENGIRISLRYKIFREIIANILVHAEYTAPFFTRFIIYKDRVEAENPSRAFKSGEITLENHSPRPKNPLLAKLFMQIGRVEELGSGIVRTNYYLPFYANGQKPHFIEADLFKTIIPLPNNRAAEIGGVNGGISGGVNGDVNGGVNFQEEGLLQAISLKLYPRAVNLSEYLKIPAKTLEKQLQGLRNKGLVIFEGAAKTGHYVLTEEGEKILKQISNNGIAEIGGVNGGISGGANGDVNGGVNFQEESLLQAISLKLYPRAVNLSEYLKIPAKTLEKQLQGLKNKGLIIFEGAAKTGCYVLTEEGEKILKQLTEKEIKK